MRVHHFLNRRYGLENLSRRRLKIALLHELNDPFELLGYSSRDKSVRAAFNRAKDELAATTGLICFSRGWRNPVQWSHYAESHHGLCLGFDMPDDMLLPVIYRTHRLKPDLAAIEGDPVIAEQHMQQIIATKFRHWRYENEVRCFIKLDPDECEDGRYFMPFSDKLVLREVIVGHRADISRAELAAAIGPTLANVIQRKARLAFRSFRVVEQLGKDRWT